MNYKKVELRISYNVIKIEDNYLILQIQVAYESYLKPIYGLNALKLNYVLIIVEQIWV